MKLCNTKGRVLNVQGSGHLVSWSHQTIKQGHPPAGKMIHWHKNLLFLGSWQVQQKRSLRKSMISMMSMWITKMWRRTVSTCNRCWRLTVLIRRNTDGSMTRGNRRTCSQVAREEQCAVGRGPTQHSLCCLVHLPNFLLSYFGSPLRPLSHQHGEDCWLCNTGLEPPTQIGAPLHWALYK